MIKHRYHKILLSLLIVVVSAVYGLPHIILFGKLRQNYNPLPISGGSPIARDEAFAYAPLVNYISRGKFFLGEVYVKEYKNYPTPFLGETLPAIFLSNITQVTKSMEKTFILTDFIFPPIIFVLLFIIMKMFVKNNSFALSAAFLTTIARDFISVIPFPKAMYEYFMIAKNQNYLLFLSRSFHPQVTFVFFLITFILLINLLRNPKKKILIILFGISFGLLTYSYLFYWSYFLLFYFLVTIFYIFKKNFEVIKALLISGLIFIVISSYYFINMYNFSKLSLANDFIQKSSLENLPFPLTIFRYLLLSIIFLVFFKKKGDKFIVFFFFMATTALIAIMSKIVIGQDLETLHYLRRAAMPIETLGFFIILNSLLKNKKKVVSFVTFLIITITLFFAIRTQIVATEKIINVHIRDRSQQLVLVWLGKNTEKGSVIGSLDTELNSLIPVYTDNYVYFAPTDRTLTPTEEGVKRFASLAKLLGINLEIQHKLLEDKSLLSYMFVYQAYDENLKLSINSQGRVLAQQLTEKISSGEYQNEVNNYKIDYIIVSPKQFGLVKPDLRRLKPVTSIDEYVIFKVTNL